MSTQVKGEIDLPKLIERFGSEEKCAAYLEDLRWPDGVECPRCDSRKISRLSERKQFECSDCRYQFSVRAGTVFQDSKLPLWKWFLAVYMIGEAKKGISANQLKRMLGVSYKTAWFLCHRIRSAMTDDSGELLFGIVEVDETYIGGKARYPVKGRGGDGSWRDRKTMVLGAIERDGKLRVSVPGGQATRKKLRDFVRENIADDAQAIYTDESGLYGDMNDYNTRHDRIQHKRDEWVRGDVHTNTVESVWSLFDRAVIGSYHKLSVKHLPAYLDEFAFRFNNRGNAFLFRDTILRLVEADALTFEALTKK